VDRNVNAYADDFGTMVSDYLPNVSAIRRPLILHITGDDLDPVVNHTTPAVKNFIDLLDDCDHVIVSLKRYSNPGDLYIREHEAQPGQRIIALGYWALPAGLFHRNAMRRLASQIRRIVEDLGVKPDLVMAHTLTVEGVVAYRLWQMLRWPYVCCVRGEVEDKFFRFKPELADHFGQVITHAEALYFVSAWFKERIEKRYPGLMRRQGLLPNFSRQASVKSIMTPRDELAFVSVLDLTMYRRKGFHHLIAAFGEARRRVPSLRLDVIGWSTPETMLQLRKLANEAGVATSVRFLGVFSHEAVLRAIPRYGAMVLPVKNETFGMIYVEALLCGVPILYAAGSAIDGYLDGLDVGVAVKAGDVPAIADGLCALAMNGACYRRALLSEYETVQARFAPTAYLRDFRQLLDSVRQRSEI
jgi:glycosyltransferase involved in cell wall biosynthesis